MSKTPPDPISRKWLKSAQGLLRAIPNSTPAKLRLARFMLRLSEANGPIRIHDQSGNRILCPDVSEPIATALLANGVYEPNTIDAILHYLPPGGTFVDVGANVGAIAVPIACNRKDARLVCVEADPAIAAILRANCDDNGIGNARVVECLAGDRNDDSVTFYRAPHQSFGMGSIGAQFDLPRLSLVQRRLDDVLDGMGVDTVYVVKLDIEGAEAGALRGLGGRLTGASPPIVIFEFVDWAEVRIPGQKAGDAQELLLSMRYRLFLLGKRGGAGVPLNEPLTVGAEMILAFPPGKSPL